MMRRQLVLLLSLWSAVGGAAGASAQEASRSSTADGPRFLLATSSAMVPVDVQRMPVLRQRVSLDVVDGSIEAAFAELTRQTGVHFVYTTDVVPPERRVRVRVQDVTMASALSALLTGTEVDVVVPEAGGTLIVRPRERDSAAHPKRTAPGTIQGYVREQGTGTPVVNAEVVVEGGGRALTNASGFYRIAKVPPGRHRVTASSIGYAKGTQEVEVGDSATVRLDFALEVVPTRLA
ncbi:MAG TPA: carboxypeptidase-like regulatory domain-containing protein, partial [Longimicrobiales bacterium]